MSQLSDFQEALRSVKPDQQANLTYEGCLWLNSEIDRLQGVAKQALLDQRAAEAENKEFKRIERLRKLANSIPYGEDNK